MSTFWKRKIDKLIFTHRAIAFIIRGMFSLPSVNIFLYIAMAKLNIEVVFQKYRKMKTSISVKKYVNYIFFKGWACNIRSFLFIRTMINYICNVPFGYCAFAQSIFFKLMHATFPNYSKIIHFYSCVMLIPSAYQETKKKLVKLDQLSLFSIIPTLYRPSSPL